MITDELVEVKKAYGDPRRTTIVDADVELSIEDLIKDEDVRYCDQIRLHQTDSGVVLFAPRPRRQRPLEATAKNDDFVEHLFIASTHAYLMIFTDDGQVYKIKVHEIPGNAGRVVRR